jgi:ATP phosphoribosyltransferase regulatory subunit HisZ
MMDLIDEWPGLADRTMMVLGHLSILDRAMAAEGLSIAVRQEIRQALSAGNLVQAEFLMASQAPKTQSLLLSQGYADFVRALGKALPEADFDHLSRLEHTLGAHMETRWDLSLTGNWPYYTDLVFSLYLKDIGQPLLNGGRFSSTVHGRTWHGVGFTLYLDSLYQAVRPEMELMNTHDLR